MPSGRLIPGMTDEGPFADWRLPEEIWNETDVERAG